MAKFFIFSFNLIYLKKFICDIMEDYQENENIEETEEVLEETEYIDEDEEITFC